MLNEKQKIIRKSMLDTIINQLLLMSSSLSNLTEERKKTYEHDLKEFIAVCYEVSEDENINGFSLNLILDRLPFNMWTLVILKMREKGVWGNEATISNFTATEKEELKTLILSNIAPLLN